jgi:hypothetical protein
MSDTNPTSGGELARAFLAAMNARDLDTMSALLTADAEYGLLPASMDIQPNTREGGIAQFKHFAMEVVPDFKVNEQAQHNQNRGWDLTCARSRWTTSWRESTKCGSMYVLHRLKPLLFAGMRPIAGLGHRKGCRRRAPVQERVHLDVRHRADKWWRSGVEPRTRV